MRVGNTRVAEWSGHLLEVRFLDRVLAGIHGSGGVPNGAGRKANVKVLGDRSTHPGVLCKSPVL